MLPPSNTLSWHRGWLDADSVIPNLVVTWASAYSEFARAKESDYRHHVFLGILKCIPVVGNATFYIQKLLTYCATTKKTQQVASKTLEQKQPEQVTPGIQELKEAQQKVERREFKQMIVDTGNEAKDKGPKHLYDTLEPCFADIEKYNKEENLGCTLTEQIGKIFVNNLKSEEYMVKWYEKCSTSSDDEIRIGAMFVLANHYRNINDNRQKKDHDLYAEIKWCSEIVKEAAKNVGFKQAWWQYPSILARLDDINNEKKDFD